MEKYEQLEKLVKLKEQGALNEEEFLIEKDKILNNNIQSTSYYKEKIIKTKIENIIKDYNNINLKNEINSILIETNNHDFFIKIIDELFPIAENNNIKSEYLEKCFNLFNLEYNKLITPDTKNLYNYFMNKLNILFDDYKNKKNITKEIDAIKNVFNVGYFVKATIKKFNDVNEVNKENYRLILDMISLFNLSEGEFTNELNTFKYIFKVNSKENIMFLKKVIKKINNSLNFQFPIPYLKNFITNTVKNITLFFFIINIIGFIMFVSLNNLVKNNFDVFIAVLINITTTLIFIFIVSKMIWLVKNKKNKSAYIFTKNINISELYEIINKTTLTDDEFIKEKELFDKEIEVIEFKKDKLKENNKNKTYFTEIIKATIPIIIISEFLLFLFLIFVNPKLNIYHLDSKYKKIKNATNNNIENKKIIKELEELASENYPPALSKLCRYYKSGIIVEKNHKTGDSLCEKAFENGIIDLAFDENKFAMFELAELYYSGLGIKKDLSKAVEWYQKAADLGNVDAMFNLGIYYKNGIGVEKDLKKAVEWFQKAADLGNTGAMLKLGIFYYYGDGIEKDLNKAVEWYKKAADLGDIDAMLKLGIFYNYGDGIEKDLNKAVEWYKKAADLGDTKAMFNLGYSYFEKDLNKAVEWWKKAADLGNENAMFSLGVCYYNGEGIEKNLKKAVEWWWKAADSGNARAMFKLGNCYYNGEVVEKNLKKAVEWYKKAADSGNTDAMLKLGNCYKKEQKSGLEEIIQCLNLKTESIIKIPNGILRINELYIGMNIDDALNILNKIYTLSPIQPITGTINGKEYKKNNDIICFTENKIQEKKGLLSIEGSENGLCNTIFLMAGDTDYFYNIIKITASLKSREVNKIYFYNSNAFDIYKILFETNNIGIIKEKIESLNNIKLNKVSIEGLGDFLRFEDTKNNTIMSLSVNEMILMDLNEFKKEEQIKIDKYKSQKAMYNDGYSGD